MATKKVFFGNVVDYDKKDPRLAGLGRDNSPFRFPGGKSYMVKPLVANVDPERKIFVEACAGGASVGLSMLKAGLIDQLVLNDKDPVIAAFWEIAAHDPDLSLIQMLRHNQEPTHDDFYRAKSVLSAPMKSSRKDKLLHAWSFFLVNRLAFSGNVVSGPMSGVDGTDEEMRCRWNPKTLEDRLMAVRAMSDKIKVTCMNARDVIARYEDSRKAKHTTIYVDPPKLRDRKIYLVNMAVPEYKGLIQCVKEYQGDADILVTVEANNPCADLWKEACGGNK